MDIRARVMTALVGVPLLVLFVAMGRAWHFSLLVLGVTVAALHEYYRIVLPDYPLGRRLGLLSGVSVALGVIVLKKVDPSFFLVLTLLALCVLYLLLDGTLPAKFDYLLRTILGTFYIGYLVPHFVLLYQLASGKEWVFLILLVIMSGDSAGYFVGRAWGRHKLAPEVSPSKTVEGAIGILAVGLLSGVVGGSYLLPGLRVWELVVLSLGLAILGQTGDLFESWIKRVFSVKDSGALLPGHGGILDRIDSLIFPAVFTTYYVRLLHS